MITKRFHYFRLLRFFKILSFVFFGITLCLVSAAGIYLFLTKDQTFELNVPQKTEEVKEVGHEFNTLKFDILYLDKEFSSLFVDDLKRQLRFAGKNTRPDAQASQKQALLSLDPSGQSRVVCEGEKVYFEYKSGNLIFKDSASPAWIKIGSISDTLDFDAKVLVVSEDTGKVYQDAASVQMHEESMTFKEDALPYAALLKNAVWIEPDKFFEVYGGSSFQEKKGAYRFSENEKGPFTFVKDGEYLSFQKGAWKKINDLSEAKAFPLAETRVYSQGKVSLRIWDVTGMKETSEKVFCVKSAPLNLRVEEIFSKIRQRSKTQVTCKVGGKTCMLKSGDWLLKISNHWKPLRSSQEITRYLNYDFDGELFVFDGIEKNESIAIFKGHLFDTMRTQMQVVRIPLTQAKKDNSKKKSKFLSKITAEQQVSQREDDFDYQEFSDFDEEEDEELFRLTQEGNPHEIQK